MSGYRNFAVAGMGVIGTSIIEQLLAKKAEGDVSSVIVLTRQTPKGQHFSSKGVEFRMIDYSRPETLVAALHGIDVVISAVVGSPEALNNQLPLADAAKQAGVHIFVPSEFGAISNGKTEGIWGIKNAVTNHLRDIGLPYVQFFVGCFIDWFLLDRPQDGAFDFANGKVVIKGSGETLMSWTTQRDIGRYVAHVLTKLPRSQLENKVFAIEGERTTLNAIVKEYVQRTGRKLDVGYESREFLEEAVKEHPDDWDNGLVRMLYLVMDRGDLIVGTPEEVNKDWPEFNPTKVVDAILERFG